VNQYSIELQPESPRSPPFPITWNVTTKSRSLNRLLFFLPFYLKNLLLFIKILNYHLPVNICSITNRLVQVIKKFGKRAFALMSFFLHELYYLSKYGLEFFSNCSLILPINQLRLGYVLA
jgi:hypothetical protein